MASETASSLVQDFQNLSWVMRSPSLLKDFSGIPVSDAECLKWWNPSASMLAQLEKDPEPLREYLDHHRRSGRLGNLFEVLIRFWLEGLLGVRELAQGVAIREGGETRGELDFIFRFPETAIIQHWEVAVKFFMCIAETPDGAQQMDHFVGQALVDRLDRKLALSIQKQLPLIRDPQAREVLKQLGFYGEIQSRLFFKGRLFYPLKWKWREVLGPIEVSAQHERGWWLAWGGRQSLEQLHEYESQVSWKSSERAWVTLGKERWMGLVEEGSESGSLLDDERLFSFLEQHFTSERGAIQLARVYRSEDGRWREPTFSSGMGRGMILGPGWPHSV